MRGVLTDLAMRSLFLFAQLQHVAQHGDPSLRLSSEEVQRRLHGERRRVVGVVDDGGAVAGCQPA